MTLTHKCCRPFAHSHIFACAGNGVLPQFDAIRQSRTASVRARWCAGSVRAPFRPEGPRRVGWLWRLLRGFRREVDSSRSVFCCFLPSRTGGLAKACGRLRGSVPVVWPFRSKTLAVTGSTQSGSKQLGLRKWRRYCAAFLTSAFNFPGGAGICVLALWVFANQTGVRGPAGLAVLCYSRQCFSLPRRLFQSRGLNARGAEKPQQRILSLLSRFCKSFFKGPNAPGGAPVSVRWGGPDAGLR